MSVHHENRSTAELERLVGRVVGLCRPPTHGLWAPGEPRMGCLTVRGTSIELSGTRPPFDCWGYEADGRALRTGVLGETVERYSLMDVDDRGGRDASVADLEREGVPHLPPSRLLSLPPGTTRQGSFAEVPPEDRRVQWLEGVDLRTGEATLLPSHYCAFFDDPPGDPVESGGDWYDATSNGAAAGPSPTAACLSGLFELLERDAFMLMWYHRLRFPLVVPEPSSALAHRIDAALTGCRVEYRMIDLSEIHGVPTVVAAVRGTVAGDTQYGIGAGAAGDLAAAAWHAVREAFSLYSLQRVNRLSVPGRPIRDDQVRTFAHHASYYRDPEHQHELEFLFEDRRSRAPGTPSHGGFDGPPREALRRLVEHLRARHIDLYAVDLTPRDVAGSGLFTYKVVSPQLIPLDTDHRARHLTNERLLNEPTRRGWRPDLPELAQLNHAPHPFP